MSRAPGRVTRPSPPPRRRSHADREILLSFWKLHVLHHAAQRPIVGQWMLDELRAHGYAVGPGTLYPVLRRMEARGWLRSRADPRGGRRARRAYRLTAEGRRTLRAVRPFLDELAAEAGSREGR
jgi:PadR family transcriptional regulator